jgi:hypothetical protein
MVAYVVPDEQCDIPEDLNILYLFSFFLFVSDICNYVIVHTFVDTPKDDGQFVW